MGDFEKRLKVLDVGLERDSFMGTLLRELTGVLEEVVGLEDATGFVSVVGQNMARKYDHDYRCALKENKLSREQVAAVLIDLKRRIGGDFFLLEQSEERLVFGNRACPFGDKVIGRPSLCMMTSNVFGSIAADNLGYAQVQLEETIAIGDAGCRVVVHLVEPQGESDPSAREYFAT